MKNENLIEMARVAKECYLIQDPIKRQAALEAFRVGFPEEISPEHTQDIDDDMPTMRGKI